MVWAPFLSLENVLHFSHARGDIRAFWVELPKDRTQPLTVEDHILKNIQRSFATELQDLSVRFRVDQNRYLRTLENQKAAVQSRIEDVEGDRKTMLLVSDDQDGETGYRQAQLIEIENAAAVVREREHEIDQVARSVAEMAVLMKDLASMVVDQGTLLDRIDYNVEQTLDASRGAVRHLRDADRYQKKRLAFCCTVLLTIGCGIMSVILLLKLLF
mmetsp:Transcript_6393/g.12770  ORF Transcript_6393/g.12770 Transcript_6393/m.12770 type:complete len:215 (-) Transcript_6393:1536-2180(-)